MDYKWIMISIALGSISAAAMYGLGEVPYLWAERAAAGRDGPEADALARFLLLIKEGGGNLPALAGAAGAGLFWIAHWLITLLERITVVAVIVVRGIFSSALALKRHARRKRISGGGNGSTIPGEQMAYKEIIAAGDLALPSYSKS